MKVIEQQDDGTVVVELTADEYTLVHSGLIAQLELNDK